MLWSIRIPVLKRFDNGLPFDTINSLRSKTPGASALALNARRGVVAGLGRVETT